MSGMGRLRVVGGNRGRGIGGPKTEAGKAAVRLNAVKHGVLGLRLRPLARSGQAPTPVLPLVESKERWEELRRDVLDWLGLEGPFLGFGVGLA